eukprot:TRINITY_DN11449_c0_g1_i1.p1 TRINITY_DN11449_c0_g1~~TRINITY_DN11449_c0_g1_i1.p1  ORF type:complete len:209 (-),score=42.91 TRINITY_DN11449_c0_g1_i1:545-1171(-)
MFEITDSFLLAFKQLNTVPDDRFPLLLERIVENAHLKESVFTKKELRKLEKMLALGSEDLDALIESCTYVVERAGWEGLSSERLGDFLQQAQLSSTKVDSFLEVWSSKGEDLILRLKERHVSVAGHSTLTAVDWRIHLQTANSETGVTSEPMGVLQLHLGESAGSQCGGAPYNTSVEPRVAAIEFTSSELYAYFQELQRIQDTLDALA